MDLPKGHLYLGRDTASDEPVIYEADNLTTHGVIVGMTGSGKTGLGIDLIEECLLNGIFYTLMYLFYILYFCFRKDKQNLVFVYNDIIIQTVNDHYFVAFGSYHISRGFSN